MPFVPLLLCDAVVHWLFVVVAWQVLAPSLFLCDSHLEFTLVKGGLVSVLMHATRNFKGNDGDD